MTNQYNLLEIEEKIRKFWEKEKIYKFDSKRKGKIYSIDTPPPYISGKMHIGHAFSYSQQDFVARYQRMKGNLFYPFGTDDNGLPTERYVEKLKGIKSKDMSRIKFIELCLEVLKDMTQGFIQDYKNLGVSCDFEIYYSTIDKETQKVSQRYFLDLCKKGFIYKKEYPVIWDSVLQSPIAQAELEDKEEESWFYTLKFKAGKKDLLIATTRPELLGACGAVFVNPNDKRYNDLIGGKVKVPLFEQEVPIIADESAEVDKGTGILMVCSYGDKYDVEAFNRYKLTPRIIINKDGSLNLENYKGMDIKSARKQIVQDLKDKKLIVEEKKITHVVNISERTKQPIEFLPAEQWFVKMIDKKKELINQGKKVNWYPKYMVKRYENWVNGLEWDWSVSRERHFGVPIPVWECECGEIILASEKELPVNPPDVKKKCPKCGKNAVGEEKVLDTWATSSLTPQIADNLVHKKIGIPFSLRPQAHDIIRTWAFYTILRSFYHENKIPWENIMISGYVTLGGRKMSKSEGTSISPKEILKEYGADALRFWASGIKLGEDMNYQEQDLVAGKKFLTKLWNATRFVFMNLEDYKYLKPLKLEKIDELFLRKLNKLIKDCTDSFEQYEYSKVRMDVERFFWNMFCDNYLEIVKTRVYQNKKGKESAQYVLYQGLLTILKLIAPIMPFISEELYQQHYKKIEKGKSIHLSRWPEVKGRIEKSEKLDLFLAILAKIRQEKTNKKKSMKAEIILSLDKKIQKDLKEMLEDLKDVMNIQKIKTGKFKVEFI